MPSDPNLTVGGSDRNGKDATNELSYLALKATSEVKTHHMPWPEVVALLQKYTRLEKQGDTGLYANWVKMQRDEGEINPVDILRWPGVTGYNLVCIPSFIIKACYIIACFAVASYVVAARVGRHSRTDGGVRRLS